VGMVRTSQGFGQKALGGRGVALGRKKEVDGRPKVRFIPQKSATSCQRNQRPTALQESAQLVTDLLH
jgi:hypothetical protein